MAGLIGAWAMRLGLSAAASGGGVLPSDFGCSFGVISTTDVGGTTGAIGGASPSFGGI